MRRHWPSFSNDSSEATAATSLKDADCAPTIGEVDQVTGVAACMSGKSLTNKQEATFSFDVVVEPGDLPQIYDYSCAIGFSGWLLRRSG